jgi:hypothetical protein
MITAASWHSSAHTSHPCTNVAWATAWEVGGSLPILWAEELQVVTMNQWVQMRTIAFSLQVCSLLPEAYTWVRTRIFLNRFNSFLHS